MILEPEFLNFSEGISTPLTRLPGQSGGDVSGSGVDNRIARWDGTSALQSSNWGITDAGLLAFDGVNVIEAASSGIVKIGLLSTKYFEIDPQSANPISTMVASNGGGEVRLRVLNSSNTSSSQSVLDVEVGGTSAGDPLTRYYLGSSTNYWSAGVRNNGSTGSYRISIGSNLSTTANIFADFSAAGLVTLGATNSNRDHIWNGKSITLTGPSTNEGNIQINILAGHASDNAAFQVLTPNGGSGDAQVFIGEQSTGGFAIGRDDSASGSFKISRSLSGVGNSDSVEILTGGSIGIAGAANSGAVINLGQANHLTGSTQILVRTSQFVVSSGGTTAAMCYQAAPGVADAAFTLPILAHFQSTGVAKGASATVTRAIGFYNSTAMTNVGASNSAIMADNNSFSGDHALNFASTLPSLFSGIVNCAAGLRTIKSTADVSSPPTDAELDSAFGSPATVGSGFMAIVDDNNAHTAEYVVWTDGTTWFYVAGTLAT